MNMCLFFILLGIITPSITVEGAEFTLSYNSLRRNMNPSKSINYTGQTTSLSSQLSMASEVENKIENTGNLNQVHDSRQADPLSKYLNKFPFRGQRIQKFWRPVNLTKNFRPGEAEVRYEFRPSLNSLKNISRGELSIPTIALYNPHPKKIHNEIHIYGSINLGGVGESKNLTLLGTLLVNNETRQHFIVTEFLHEVVTSAFSTTTTEMTRATVSIVFTVNSPCNHLKPQQCSSFVHDIKNPNILPLLRVNYYQPSRKPV